MLLLLCAPQGWKRRRPRVGFWYRSTWAVKVELDVFGGDGEEGGVACAGPLAANDIHSFIGVVTDLLGVDLDNVRWVCVRVHRSEEVIRCGNRVDG